MSNTPSLLHSRIARPVRGLATGALVLALLGTVATTVPVQAQPSRGTVTVERVSDVRPDWLHDAIASPNGRFYLLSSYREGNTILAFDSQLKRWSSTPGQLGFWARWAPNGRFIAYTIRSSPGSTFAVWIRPVDTTTGLPTGTARRISTRNGQQSSWSPDGQRIAFFAGDSGRFRIFTVPFNGGDEQLVFDGPGQGFEPAWTPDGRTILIGYAAPGQPARLVRIDVATRKTTMLPTLIWGRVAGVSSDGQRIAYFNPIVQRLFIASAKTGAVLDSMTLPSRVKPLEWSRTRANVIEADEHIVPMHVEVLSVSTGAITPLMAPDSVAISIPTFSPDGKQLLYLQSTKDGQRQVHMVPAAGGPRAPIGEPGAVIAASWSPDGHQIAYCTHDALRVYDLRSRTDRAVYRVSATRFLTERGCVWRRDGAAVRLITRSVTEQPQPTSSAERELLEITPAGAAKLLSRIKLAGGLRLANDTLLFISDRTSLTMRNLRTGTDRVVYTGQVWDRPLSVTPDGKSLALAAGVDDADVPLIVDLVSGTSRRVPYALGGEMAGLQFHPDGKHLVAYSCVTCVEPNYTEKWDIVLLPINGDPARNLTASQKSYKDHGYPSISPDGRSIAFEGEASYNTRIVRIVLPPQR